MPLYYKNFKAFDCSLSILIGKTLVLSPSFPPDHTEHATFTALGVPSYIYMTCGYYSIIITTTSQLMPLLSSEIKYDYHVFPYNFSVTRLCFT